MARTSSSCDARRNEIEAQIRATTGLDAVSKGRAVLVVLPAADHPTPAVLGRLAREYGLKDDLNGEWAVRPLELVREADEQGLRYLYRLIDIEELGFDAAIDYKSDNIMTRFCEACPGD